MANSATRKKNPKGPGGGDERSLKADDKLNTVLFYLGLFFFLKSIAPGFRVGWIVGGDEFKHRLNIMLMCNLLKAISNINATRHRNF